MPKLFVTIGLGLCAVAGAAAFFIPKPADDPGFVADAPPSERLLALEMGYRFRPAPRFSLDIAAFYNQYDEVRTNEPGATDTSVVEVPSMAQTPPSPAWWAAMTSV